MANKIFISYSRQDQYFARALAVDLEDCGAEIWIDVDDIPVGSRWSSAIQEGLSESQVMLLVASPDSMSSTNVEDEWNYFLDKKKPILIIYWRFCEAHFQLWRIPRIEFRQSQVSYHAALPVLINQLKVYGLQLNIPSNLPTLHDSFMRQALRRALSEAAEADAKSPLQDEGFDTGENLQPDRNSKPITRRRRPKRRARLFFSASVLVALLLINSALYIRFFRDSAMDGVATEVSPSQQPSPNPSPTHLASPESASLELVFNGESIYIRNISAQRQDISALIFRQSTETGERFEFEAADWQTRFAERNIIYNLGVGRCFQLGISDRISQIRPPDCRWLDSWVSRGVPEFYFWLPQSGGDAAFEVYWENERVTSCPISAQVCRFSLDAFR